MGVENPNTREIAEHWFKVLKSAPYADSWNIEDSFVEKLSATWLWVVSYFEFLDTIPEKESYLSQFATIGIYALQQTLDLRPDCASAFFLLMFLSRVSARLQISPEKLEAVEEKAAQAINQLVKDEEEKIKLGEWPKWFEELWNQNRED